MSDHTTSVPSEDAERPKDTVFSLAGMDHAPFSDLHSLTGMSYEMPPDLEACYTRNAKPQLRYAHSMLGDKDAAKTIVRRCYRYLALNWRNVQKEGSPEAYAWKLLKQRVEIHLRLAGRPARSEVAQSAALQHTARATLEAARHRFTAMESALGLYTAIAGLPERQYDVIVLHYVLGYPSRRIAHIMGIKADTVRYHRRLARQRLAIKLDLSIDPAADEKE
ncbi:sigma-70 family RNA polymerase sigma factor [Streptomyces sp. NPDC054871]